jgi:hypothetical protein
MHRENQNFGLDHSTQVDAYPPIFDTNDQNSAETIPPQNEKPRHQTDELLVDSGEHEKLDMMGFTKLSGDELVGWQAGNCPLPKESVVTIIRFVDENSPDKSELYYEYGDKPIYTVNNKNEKEKGKRRYLFMVKEFPGPKGEQPKKKMIRAQEVGERILPVFTKERNKNYEQTKAEWRPSNFQEINSIIGNPLHVDKRYVTLLTNAKSDKPNEGEYFLMTSREKPGDEINSLDSKLIHDGFRVLMWEKRLNVDTTPISASFHVIKREDPLTSLSQPEIEQHINDIFASMTSGEQSKFTSGELEQKAA